MLGFRWSEPQFLNGLHPVLLFLCLAIAVKIEVVSRTYEMRSELEDLPEPGHPD